MPHLKVENLSIASGTGALGGVGFEVRPGEISLDHRAERGGEDTVFNCISGIYKPNEGKLPSKDVT